MQWRERLPPIIAGGGVGGGVEFVVGSRPSCKGFSPGSPVFFLS